MPQSTVPAGGSPSRRVLLGSAAGLTLAGVAGTPSASAVGASSSFDTSGRHVSYREWSGRELCPGRFTGRRHYVDPFDGTATSRSYDVATWVSPVVRPGFGLTELVASWNADTPGGSWVEVSVRGRSGGVATKEYVLGRWCRHDPAQGGGIHRTSVNGQATPSPRSTPTPWRPAPGTSSTSGSSSSG